MEQVEEVSKKQTKKNHPARLEGFRIISRYKPSTQRSADDSRFWYRQVYRPWSSGLRSLIRSFWILCFTSDVNLPFNSNCLPFLNHRAWTLGMDNWQDSVHDWPSLPEVSCRCFSTSGSETQKTWRRNLCQYRMLSFSVRYQNRDHMADMKKLVIVNGARIRTRSLYSPIMVSLALEMWGPQTTR